MDNKDIILKKVQKLLSLGSNNPNENEARAALKKAALLAEEHGLAISDINPETGKVTEFSENGVTLDGNRHRKWAYPLAGAIADCFDCRAIKTRNKLNFLGTKTDVEMAVWYYNRLRLAIIMGGKKKFKLMRDRDEYGYGAYQALAMRLRSMFVEERQKARSAETTALVVVKTKEVAEEYHRRYPNASYVRYTSNTNGSAEARTAGRSDGQKMSLARGYVTA
jgi:hypothetical protein